MIKSVLHVASKENLDEMINVVSRDAVSSTFYRFILKNVDTAPQRLTIKAIN